jgi:hypothetical protein
VDLTARSFFNKNLRSEFSDFSGLHLYQGQKFVTLFEDSKETVIYRTECARMDSCFKKEIMITKKPNYIH